MAIILKGAPVAAAISEKLEDRVKVLADKGIDRFHPHGWNQRNDRRAAPRLPPSHPAGTVSGL